MANDKLLDKLAKMVKARDGEAAIGNEAAAEAFAQAINKMLLDHDLSMTDVEHRASIDDDPIIELWVDLKKFGAEEKKSRIGWQEALAHVVANAHLCKFLVIRGSNRIVFVGTKAHVAVAEYSYGTLVAATEKMSWVAYNKQFYGKGAEFARGFRASWLSAFVLRIAERLEEMKRKAVAETGNSGTALMRINQSLVKADTYLKNKNVGMSKGAKMSGRFNAEGRAAGRRAADEVRLGQAGIGAKATTGLLK